MDLRKDAYSKSGPFKKMRSIYGKNMEDMPNLDHQKAPDNIEEILKYNREKNTSERTRAIIFNSFMILAGGVFIFFLMLFFLGYMDIYLTS
ncbi:MAG: hypothetical protein AAF843_01940 [Bacteroidota bacterium]